ncbi:MAG: hypothetical protein HC923_09675 [Myxococcales bacterium]|nr:hypothetical protein [Myxococcales bacterium]
MVGGQQDVVLGQPGLHLLGERRPRPDQLPQPRPVRAEEAVIETPLLLDGEAAAVGQPLAVADEETALAVGDTGRIWTWDGIAWTNPRFRVPGEFSGQLIEPRGKLHAAWTANGNEFYIVGSGGAAYRSNGGFQNFEALDTRFAEPLRGVWGTGNTNVYGVGLDSIILRYTDQWRRVTNNGADELPTTFLFGIHGRGGNDFLVVGWRGVALHFDGRWRAEVTTVDSDLRSVWMAPKFLAFPEEPDSPEVDIAFAVGTSGTILRRQLPLPEPTPPN